MKKPNLVKLLAKWQGRLRLLDWDILVEYARGRDMISPTYYGQNSYSSQYKTSRIRILDPIDREDNFVQPDDIEQTLVHELLHCTLAPFHGKDTGLLDGWKSQELERIVDQLAWSLVKLDRGQA